MCRRCRRRLPPDPFLDGAFAAWGPFKGYTGGRHSLSEAANRTAALGIKWVALLLDDDGSSQDAKDTAAYNRSIWDQFHEQFSLRDILPGCWFTQGGSLYLTPPDAALAIAEIEGPGDYDGVVSVIRGTGGGPLPTCPLGTVTNLSTMTRERAKVLIDARFACLPEAYMNENANWTPDVMDRSARNLGWPTSQPVAGVYPVGGNPVPSYAQWKSWPLASYLLEYLI